MGGAAAELGISPGRVRALIASGALAATKVGGVYLVEEDALDSLARRDRPAHVRAFSPRLAWACAALADGVRPDWISTSELSRLRRRLGTSTAETGVWQARLAALSTQRSTMRVGTALRERLLADVRVARSGSSVLTDRAAKWRRIELPVSGASASIWVRSADELVALAREYGLIAAAVGDVSVAVAGVPGLGACGDGDGNAYRLVVAADLLSSTDARGRRAGRDLLERVVQERRWSARPGEPVGISGPR